MRKKDMIKLNLGCGWRNFGEEWTHIDGGDYPHVKSHDITSLLDYEDDSVDLIYVSHVFEYFDREEGLDVLKEWYRVLKPKGTLRIAVPDFEMMAKLYSQGKFPLKNFLGPLYGKMEMGMKGGETGNIIYHKTAYDFENLKEIMENAGFQNFKRYDWRTTPPHDKIDDHSQCYLPREGTEPNPDDPHNKETGYLISLNVEAEK
jgi:predicted SAM-dependent methyltransferase